VDGTADLDGSITLTAKLTAPDALKTGNGKVFVDVETINRSVRLQIPWVAGVSQEKL
jgi:hypothetical protein